MRCKSKVPPLLLATAITHSARCGGRKQYRFKIVEIVVEILVPLAVLGVGFFASVTALKTVSFNNLGGS